MNPTDRSLIYQYLKRYQQDPTSRVFAPLAEAYRKAGLPQDAADIAREGLSLHPNFMGGRVALARALSDLKKYDEVIRELQAVVREVPDNLIAQRLLGESHLMLGHLNEALEAYKMLLYFNPHDEEALRLVQELETKAYDQGDLVVHTDELPPSDSDFEVKSIGRILQDSPDERRADWIQKVELLQELLLRVEHNR